MDKDLLKSHKSELFSSNHKSLPKKKKINKIIEKYKNELDAKDLSEQEYNELLSNYISKTKNKYKYVYCSSLCLFPFWGVVGNDFCRICFQFQQFGNEFYNCLSC